MSLSISLQFLLLVLLFHSHSCLYSGLFSLWSFILQEIQPLLLSLYPLCVNVVCFFSPIRLSIYPVIQGGKGCCVAQVLSVWIHIIHSCLQYVYNFLIMIVHSALFCTHPIYCMSVHLQRGIPALLLFRRFHLFSRVKELFPYLNRVSKDRGSTDCKALRRFVILGYSI